MSNIFTKIFRKSLRWLIAPLIIFSLIISPFSNNIAQGAAGDIKNFSATATIVDQTSCKIDFSWKSYIEYDPDLETFSFWDITENALSLPNVTENIQKNLPAGENIAYADKYEYINQASNAATGTFIFQLKLQTNSRMASSVIITHTPTNQIRVQNCVVTSEFKELPGVVSFSTENLADIGIKLQNHMSDVKDLDIGIIMARVEDWIKLTSGHSVLNMDTQYYTSGTLWQNIAAFVGKPGPPILKAGQWAKITDSVAKKDLATVGLALLEAEVKNYISFGTAGFVPTGELYIATAIYEDLKLANSEDASGTGIDKAKLDRAKAAWDNILSKSDTAEKAQAGKQPNWLLDTIGEAVHDLLQGFGLALASMITKVLGWINGWKLLNIASPNSFQPSWTIVRDLANIIFVAILLFIAIANIIRFQAEQYSIRVALPRFIIAIVLANFSLFIAGFLITFANSAQDYFLTKNIEVPAINLIYPTTARDILNIIGVLVLTILILVIFFLTLMFLVVMMFARLAVIYLLVVIAPVAFAAFALPTTRQYFQQWWKYFSNFLIIGPLTAFCLFMSAAILSNIPAGIELKGLDEAGFGSTDTVKFMMAALLIGIAAYLPAMLGGKFFGWGAAMVGGFAKAYGRWLGGRGVQFATRGLTGGAGRMLARTGIPKLKELGSSLTEMRGFNPIRSWKAVMAIRDEKEKVAQSNLQKRFQTYLGAKMAKHPPFKKFMGEYGEAWTEYLGERADAISKSTGLLGASLMYQDGKGNWRSIKTRKIIKDPKVLERGYAAWEGLYRMKDNHLNQETRRLAGLAYNSGEAGNTDEMLSALHEMGIDVPVGAGVPEEERAVGIGKYDVYGEDPLKAIQLRTGIAPAEVARPELRLQNDAKLFSAANAQLAREIVAENPGLNESDVVISLNSGQPPKNLARQPIPLTGELQARVNQQVSSFGAIQTETRRIAADHFPTVSEIRPHFDKITKTEDLDKIISSGEEIVHSLRYEPKNLQATLSKGVNIRTLNKLTFISPNIDSFKTQNVNTVIEAIATRISAAKLSLAGKDTKNGPIAKRAEAIYKRRIEREAPENYTPEEKERKEKEDWTTAEQAEFKDIYAEVFNIPRP